MDDDEIPDLGDDLGLRRLVVRTIAQIRASDMDLAERRAWIEMIEAQYRTAGLTESCKA